MKLFVLLPSYNEGEALPHLLDSMVMLVESLACEHEIVVINDGSQDDTEEAARRFLGRLNINIINHEKNMGLGRAVNTGLSYFCESCGDDAAAVVMDADNTHNPQLVPRMLQGLSTGNDVVIASRYEHGGKEIGLSALRRIFSAGASTLLTIFYRIQGVKDYTCGYRAYTGRIIKRAYEVYGENFIEENGFTCMAEIIIKLSFIGAQISEVPLVLRYDLKKGKSKMKVFKTIRRYFTLILNIGHYRKLLESKPAFIEGKEK